MLACNFIAVEDVGYCGVAFELAEGPLHQEGVSSSYLSNCCHLGKKNEFKGCE